MFQVRIIRSEDQIISFFLTFGRGVYIFEESPISIQDVIGDVFCPRKYCFNREECEYFDGHVKTPRSVCACGRCGTRLFVQKGPFTLQAQVMSTKNRQNIFFVKRRTCHPTNICSLMSYFNQPSIERKNCMRTTKCVYISTNKTCSFCDCKSCKAWCHVLKMPFRDQN